MSYAGGNNGVSNVSAAITRKRLAARETRSAGVCRARRAESNGVSPVSIAPSFVEVEFFEYSAQRGMPFGLADAKFYFHRTGRCGNLARASYIADKHRHLYRPQQGASMSVTSFLTTLVGPERLGVQHFIPLLR
jgi:hypothetical protein